MEKAVNSQNNLSASPEEVFERYTDTVYRLAFVRTKNKYDADDVLQEVFLRYMKIWQKMESEEHIKAMLIRMTVNCSNSLLSSAWFKRTDPLSDVLLAECMDESYILFAVLKLPIKYRTVIHLHYYMGYSVEEIAKITSTKSATVKTQLSRGRQQLKIILKADDFDV